MNRDDTLRQLLNDLGVKIITQTTTSGRDKLRIRIRTHADGLFFWSDKKEGIDPNDAAFILTGRTGEVERGGEFILRVTAGHSTRTPWSRAGKVIKRTSECTNLFACSLWIRETNFETALSEIRDFVKAGLHQAGKFIVVRNYPKI